MTDPIPFDEFHALLEGRLDPASAARLSARLDAEPALRAEFDVYREVHAFTASAVGAAPSSSLAFERLDAARRAGRLRRLRPWIVVAATLLVAVGAAAYVRMQPRVVELHAISLAEERIDLPPFTPIPAALATYRPVVDGKLNWMTSLEEARAVARATERPLFVWVHHQECPMCIELDRGAMRDAALVAEAGKFVPVKLDVMKAPREVQQWCAAGWPYLAVQTADGRKVSEFAGEMDVDKLVADLAKGDAGVARAIAWDVANETAALYAKAEDARTAGRYDEALRGYDAVAKRVGTSGSDVATDAFARSVDLRREARDALFEAKKVALSDDPDGKRAGARRLSEAAERFRGTPYGSDLAEVEQELRATGRFPVLVEAK